MRRVSSPDHVVGICVTTGLFVFRKLLGQYLEATDGLAGCDPEEDSDEHGY
jgi:hypothetical protein